MYKALLVDDEKLLLDSLEIILSLSDIEIIGKATDGNEALKILGDYMGKCDIALVDLNMKGMGGIELISHLKNKYPDIKILVLTTFYDDENITMAISNGAHGYLLKDSGKDAIIGAINQIMGGSTVLDSKVMMKLSMLVSENMKRMETSVTGGIRGVTSGGVGNSLSANGLNGNTLNENDASDEFMESCDLTTREKEICVLIAEGYSNRQIADKLYISEGTVKNYISNIYDKTGIHDRVKLSIELKK